MYAEPGERRMFTVDEVYRMVDAGVLDEDEHVELLEGELCPMSPQGTEHRALTIAFRDRLVRAFGDGFHLQDHSPVRLDDYNLPEPDVAVVRGAAMDYYQRLPTGADVPLVVEIAMTFQSRDRRKARLYARAGVEVYWILDVRARTLTVHREPGPEGYADVRVLARTDAVAVRPGTDPWPIADLLP